MIMPKNDYKSDLLTRLRDPEYAAGYLSFAKAESPETFLLALRDVAEAQKGMAKVASEARVNRENLYRMLSEEGNPRLSSLDAIFDALGFEMAVQVKGSAAHADAQTIPTVTKHARPDSDPAPKTRQATPRLRHRRHQYRKVRRAS